MAETVLQVGAPPGTSGVEVTVSEPIAGAEQSPFGTTLFAGAYQWGPVDEVVEHSGKPDFNALRGTPFAEDHAALCCEHFYAMADGAGRVLTLRLTDGNERQGWLSVYGRDVALDRALLSETGVPIRAMYVQGAYSGKRGGQEAFLAGRVADLSVPFSAAGTFDTGRTMLVDEYVGAILKMDSVVRSYRVTGNTAAGLLSIEVPSGDTGPGAVAGGWWVQRLSPNARTIREGLGLKVDSSLRKPTSEVALTTFDMRTLRAIAPAYPSLSLDSNEDSYVTEKLETDRRFRRQHWLAVTADPDTVIGDFTADELRPANWTGMPARVSPTATRATGTITCTLQANLVDGETFTIGDGRNTALVYEFDVAGDGVTAGNVLVDVSAAVTADNVRDVIVTAVNAQFVAGNTKVSAHQYGAGVVGLQGQACQVANVAITETVAHAAFVVAGMTGGAGPTNSVSLETTHWEVTGTGNPFLDPTSIIYGADAWHRMRAVCTFTAPTAFTVQYETWDGLHVIAQAADLPAGALSTAYNPGGTLLPRFTAHAGAVAAVATDVLTVYFNPVPQYLNRLDSAVYVHAHDQGFAGTNDIRTWLRPMSNTVSAVTFQSSVDVGTDHNVATPGAPWAVAPTIGDYNLAGAETFIYNLQSEGAVTLTQTLVGAAITAEALATELNTQEAAAHTDVPRLVFSATADNRLQAEAVYDTGESADLIITTGTLNAILGFDDNTTYYGSEGTALAIAYPEDLQYGRDGIGELGEANEYEDAFHLDTSPINNINRSDYGLVKMAMPGVSGTTGEPEQNRATEYADARGKSFRRELDPASASDETAAAAYVEANFLASRNAPCCWDSYGIPKSLPYAGERVAVPMTGAILGMEARKARDDKGYYMAAAGPDANIGTLFEQPASLPAGTFDLPWRREDLLNPVGVQTLQQDGKLLYPNGDRNADTAYDGTVWKHKQETVLQEVAQLVVAARRLIWEDLSTETMRDAIIRVRPLLKTWAARGWYALDPNLTFDEQFKVQAGPDENPPAVQVLGELRMVIEHPPVVGTAERVVIALATGGVTAL